MEDDTLTEKGANALAMQIRRYWKAKGREVKTYLTGEFGKDRHLLFGIRSDMVNGYPK